MCRDACRRSSKNRQRGAGLPPNSFVGCLVLILLMQSYILISPFVYSGYMAMSMKDGLTASNAGSYAGLISSSFMFGRVWTSYYWGKLSDVYGRKKVVMYSVVMSSVFMLCFGLSTNLAQAVTSRIALGMVNCIPGTIKTIIAEATTNKQWQDETMGFIFGFWGLGFLIAPLISGALADPVSQYGADAGFGWLKPILLKYPFILPNAFGSALCLACAVWFRYAFDETLTNARDLPWEKCCGARLEREMNRYKRVGSEGGGVDADDVQIDVLDVDVEAEGGVEVEDGDNVELVRAAG